MSPVAPLRACYQSIACCFTATVARIPDARTPADAAKQRTVVYLSGRGRGNRCFCRRELITIVTPLSRLGSAKTAASVCLYSVYRKQERLLFTAALEQTSNVPTAIVRRRACGLLYPASGRQSCLRRAARLLFDRPLAAISCAHTPVTSTDCPAVYDGRGGGGDSPAR